MQDVQCVILCMYLLTGLTISANAQVRSLSMASSAAQPSPAYKVGHLHTDSAQNCEFAPSSASQRITAHFHIPHSFDLLHSLLAMSSFANETFSFSTLPPISSMMSQAPLPVPHNEFVFGQYLMQQHAFRVCIYVSFACAPF